ncbi:hypothetical protein [Enterococcus termitis]|uniref:hypothetical protein n=1 Tax=Enterococcus termitis TaxID=332950 RepID=UPI001112D03B|nr:hypothetical protein [Enterococcus termitis]
MNCEHCRRQLKESEKVFDYTIGAILCDYCLELLVLADRVPECPTCGCGVGIKRDPSDCESCKYHEKAS